jgi:hypothetical protein
VNKNAETPQSNSARSSMESGLTMEGPVTYGSST